MRFANVRPKDHECRRIVFPKQRTPGPQGRDSIITRVGRPRTGRRPRRRPALEVTRRCPWAAAHSRTAAGVGLGLGRLQLQLLPSPPSSWPDLCATAESLRGRPRGRRLGEHLPLALRHPEMPISVCATTTMVDTFRSAHPAAGLVTRSIGDDDCYRHSRHRPASSGSVGQCTTRRRSAPDRRPIRQSPTTANYGPRPVVLDLIA